MSEATQPEAALSTVEPKKLHSFEIVWTVEYRMPIRAATAMEAQATWRRTERPEARSETRAELVDHEVESIARCCPSCGAEIEEE